MITQHRTHEQSQFLRWNLHLVSCFRFHFWAFRSISRRWVCITHWNVLCVNMRPIISWRIFEEYQWCEKNKKCSRFFHFEFKSFIFWKSGCVTLFDPKTKHGPTLGRKTLLGRISKEYVSKARLTITLCSKRLEIYMGLAQHRKHESGQNVFLSKANFENLLDHGSPLNCSMSGSSHSGCYTSWVN